MKQTDSTQNPVTPQFPLGASSDEAYDHAQLLNSPTPEPGAIVARMQSQQWNLPRNMPDYEQQDAQTSTTSNQGTPYG